MHDLRATSTANARQVNRAATTMTMVAGSVTIMIAIVSKACKDTAVVRIAMDVKKGVMSAKWRVWQRT